MIDDLQTAVKMNPPPMMCVRYFTVNVVGNSGLFDQEAAETFRPVLIIFNIMFAGSWILGLACREEYSVGESFSMTDIAWLIKNRVSRIWNPAPAW